MVLRTFSVSFDPYLEDFTAFIAIFWSKIAIVGHFLTPFWAKIWSKLQCSTQTPHENHENGVHGSVFGQKVVIKRVSMGRNERFLILFTKI